MRYIPGSTIIKPNSISARLIPEMRPSLRYILQNIRPTKIIENGVEIKRLKYVFVEHKASNDYVVKNREDFHRVEMLFDNYAKADAVLNKILGVQENSQIDSNEYDPTPTSVDRNVAIRRSLNDAAAKEFNRRR